MSNNAKKVEWTLLHMSKSIEEYDVIMGQDLLVEVGIDLLFSEQMIIWGGRQVTN